DGCGRYRCERATSGSTGRASRGRKEAAGTARRPASPPRWSRMSSSHSSARKWRSSSPPSRRVAAPSGIRLYDKPAGITSHDVVARVRRRLGRGVKVGHAGTLDPFATGLLLVLVGPATRVQRFLTAL